jgi:hypothetical protein
MSNVIQFLESLGANAASAADSAERYIASVEALEIEEAERDALLHRDRLELGSVLGGRSKMYFAVLPAEEDEPSEDEGQEDESPDHRDGEPEPDRF